MPATACLDHMQRIDAKGCNSAGMLCLCGKSVDVALQLVQPSEELVLLVAVEFQDLDHLVIECPLPAGSTNVAAVGIVANQWSNVKAVSYNVSRTDLVDRCCTGLPTYATTVWPLMEKAEQYMLLEPRRVSTVALTWKMFFLAVSTLDASGCSRTSIMSFRRCFSSL